MTGNENAARLRAGGAGDGAAIGDELHPQFTTSPANFQALSIDDLLTRKQQLDTVMKQTGDDTVWADSFLEWCSIVDELNARGYRPPAVVGGERW